MVFTTKKSSHQISRQRFDAVLFDMDGVVTKTATLHCAAWKVTFDALLESQFHVGEGHFSEEDYLKYVDGRRREDGVKTFLASRSLTLPEGQVDDPPGFTSICAVAHLKDAQFLRLMHERGVEVFESTIALIHDLKLAGFEIAIVTASKNGVDVLNAASVIQLFDVRVDGNDANKLHLKGKPAPDLFLEGARQLGVKPERAVVVEDAAAGVEAGRAGGFGLVIGIARSNNANLLKEHGADIVVHDLQEVSVAEATTVPRGGMTFPDTTPSESSWVISYDEFSPALEQQRESLCALGNGYFSTRGAAPESMADKTHYPGTYLAGGYNSVWRELGTKSFLREELVNMPNWLLLLFRIDDDEWWRIEDVEIQKFSQRLNIREGVLYRDVTFRDARGRETSISERRFVHMSRPHLAALELKIVPLNWSGIITIRSALDGRVSNNGNNEGEQRHLEFVKSGTNDDTMSLEMITSESRLTVVQAVKTEILLNGSPTDIARRDLQHREYVAQETSFKVSKSDAATARKVASLYTSRDKAISNPQDAAIEGVHNAPSFDILLAEHVHSWRAIWEQFELHVQTADTHSSTVPSQLLHLNSFHAIQTVSEHSCDLDVGIPARGWTGEGYHGHVFWDDLFVFPFVNLRLPAAAAALLKYRYRRLPAARVMAKEFGARGAKFPWQSGSSGKEQTPDFWWMPEKQAWIPDRSHMEIHVNAAIAYNIWQYYQATLDLDFIRRYGAEMLFEIARFFASYAKYDSADDRYHIMGVVGPDEFHTGYPGSDKPGVNDNAYTNVMAVWTLCRAIDLFETASQQRRMEMCQKLDLQEDEFALWNDVSRKMYLPLRHDGIINQFEGYEDLQEFPRNSSDQLDRDLLKQVLEDQDGAPNQYKVAKQADVLMLFYLLSPIELKEIFERLGYSYQYAAIGINSQYYDRRTVNDSTLSRVAHAWVLSKVDRLRSWKLLSSSVAGAAPSEGLNASNAWDIFYEALGTDFFDIAARGTAKTGVHMGAMAGTLDIVQRCYTGLETRGDVLWLEPQLPAALSLLSFKLNFRDQGLSFQITHDSAIITAAHSKAKPIKIGYRTQIFELSAGETMEIDLQRQAAA